MSSIASSAVQGRPNQNLNTEEVKVSIIEQEDVEQLTESVPEYDL
jgi:hypothetical protein